MESFINVVLEYRKYRGAVLQETQGYWYLCFST